jgi:alkylhydroperoxidase family enzyme
LIAEEVSAIGDQHVVRRPDVAPTALTEEQAAAAVWVAIAINAWNRVSIVSHYPVAP